MIMEIGTGKTMMITFCFFNNPCVLVKTVRTILPPISFSCRIKLQTFADKNEIPKSHFADLRYFVKMIAVIFF